MKCYIVMLNLWIALVYYLYFCHQRPYNYATVLIWIIIAAIWIYDVATGYTAFERNRKHERLATLFMLLPLTFPLISPRARMHYPMMASPVMPSSVALFTIGFMLAFSQRVNLFIVLFLCHWAPCRSIEDICIQHTRRCAARLRNRARDIYLPARVCYVERLGTQQARPQNGKHTAHNPQRRYGNTLRRPL